MEGLIANIEIVTVLQNHWMIIIHTAQLLYSNVLIKTAETPYKTNSTDFCFLVFNFTS
jgi:hypothetical protein